MSTTELEARAAELRAVVNQPSEKDLAARELVEVETRLAEQRKAQERDAAKKRMDGIARGRGSLVQEYERDRERVERCTAELDAAIQTINERYQKLVALELEAHDLSKAFALPTPEFAHAKGDRVQAPADLLRGAAPESRLFDVTDYVRLVRTHEARREGPARTRHDAVRDDPSPARVLVGAGRAKTV